ncbi:hypothetical protein HWV62_11952 [Athelia sp. TMB]|nr:hypothetical protein HWV62_11952 [Athelia sp. TMB]
MSRKRQRSDSFVRVQVSRPSASSSRPTETNTHLQIGIDTRDESRARSRSTLRTAHVTQPVEVVDLSDLLVEDDGGIMVDANLDGIAVDDMSDLAPGMDEDEVVEEDGATEAEEAQGQVSSVGNSFSLSGYGIFDDFDRFASLKNGFPSDNCI